MKSPLYLTFDDGPDPVWTPRVLDVLARHGVHATFFVLGWRVRESPALLGELLADGHRVEFHGNAHLDHRVARPEELTADTESALRLLAEHGVTPQWWRLPFGRPGPTTAALAEEHGLRIVGWDADAHDWRGDGWTQQPAQISDVAHHGGVVLLHDAIVPGLGRTSAENTVEIVDALLQIADRKRTPVRPLPAATTRESIPSEPCVSPFGPPETPAEPAASPFARAEHGEHSPFERTEATHRALQAERRAEEVAREDGQSDVLLPRSHKTA